MSAPCVLFAGHKNRDGYGQHGRGGRVVYAHRAAWERERGPIPLGMTVDHLCFNPACVNVAHLRLLPNVENAANQRSAAKASCVHGHPYDEANTARARKTGRRQCLACRRAYNARVTQRRRAAAKGAK